MSGRLLASMGAFVVAATAAAGSFPNPFEVSSLDGTNGFIINGIAANDQLATSVGGVGDVNGDGIDDIGIGAKRADPGGIIDAGQAYIIFGTADGIPHPFDPATLDGTNGFAINGITTFDEAGGRVAPAGDVNGDGIDDLLVGSEAADTAGGEDAGQTYVIFGSDLVWPAEFELSSLDGTNGFALHGEHQFDETGGALAHGDINDDGFMDVILGAKDADPVDMDRGIVYVVYGSDQPFPAVLALGSLDGTNGFAAPGLNLGDELGAGVASGDVNNDGIDDIIAGATGAGTLKTPDSGRTFVIFGARTGLAASFDLGGLDGTNGFTIEGASTDDEAGGNVAAGSDINDDGIEDIIIGARGADPNLNPLAGAAFVVYGRDVEFQASINLGDLDGTNGFVINGIDPLDDCGRVELPGDVNGDGINDIMLGAPDADPNGIFAAGESYLVFGAAVQPAEVELADLDGTNGFVINGMSINDTSGRNIGAAGDVNGDGAPDIVVGAKFGDPPSGIDAGEAYVIYGIPGETLPCPGDIDGDGAVAVLDLVEMIVLWGSADPSADLDGDGVVGVLDMIELIVNWGPCP